MKKRNFNKELMFDSYRLDVIHCLTILHYAVCFYGMSLSLNS
jgi:hypothetical protein